MTNHHVKVFSLESNVSLFPSYLICAAERLNEAQIRAESFLLVTIKGKKAKLIAMEVVVESHVSSAINENFVVEECLLESKKHLVNAIKLSPRSCSSEMLPIIQIKELDMAYFLHGFFQQKEIMNKLDTISEISKIASIKHAMAQLSTERRIFSFVPMEK
jgi:hypothetical protein